MAGASGDARGLGGGSIMWPFSKSDRGADASGGGPAAWSGDVSNPSLEAAIMACSKGSNPEIIARIMYEAAQATFVLIGQPPPVQIVNGRMCIPKGSKLAILTLTDNQNRRLLALFTCRREANAHRPNAPVFPMSAKDAFGFVLAASFDGAVINPSGMTCAFSRKHCQVMAEAPEVSENGR